MFNKLTSLLIILPLVILPIGLSLLHSNPVLASMQTDKTWQAYFSGSKVVKLSSYSSGDGGGGGTSKQEIHFCSNGSAVYNSSSSMTEKVDGSSAVSAVNSSSTTTWKIVESKVDRVILETIDLSGVKTKSSFKIGQGGKLYDGSNMVWQHTTTDVCK
jgi:hypothetical protein